MDATIQTTSQSFPQRAQAANPNKALWEKGDFTSIARSMRESGDTLGANRRRAGDAHSGSGLWRRDDGAAGRAAWRGCARRRHCVEPGARR